jgi:hypothetical protein
MHPTSRRYFGLPPAPSGARPVTGCEAGNRLGPLLGPLCVDLPLHAPAAPTFPASVPGVSSRTVIKLAGLMTRIARFTSPRVLRGPVPGPGPDSVLGPNCLSAGGSQALLSGLPSRWPVERWCGLFWRRALSTPVQGVPCAAAHPGPFLKRVAGARYAGAGQEPCRV